MTAVRELLDAAAGVPLWVWAAIVGAWALGLVAIVGLCSMGKAEPPTPEQRARVRDEFLALRHPRRVHRGRR